MNALPIKSQTKIIRQLFKIGDIAIAQRDHKTLFHLSEITTELNMYNTEAPISFFDIGEFFYDTSTNIQSGIEQSQDEWTDELSKKLRRQLRELN